MKKILMVGNPRELGADRGFLDRVSLELHTSATNREALERQKGLHADIIVAPLHCHSMAGDMLCAALRRDPVLKGVSVIIVCPDRREDIERASRCRANTHISMPVDGRALLDAVGKLLDIPHREAYRVVLHAEIEGTSSSTPIVGTSVNISASGILIETDRDMQKGDHLSCSFVLPGMRKVSIKGEVMRAFGSSSTGKKSFGVRFVNASPDDKAAIESFVKSRGSTHNRA